jgi:hypothetical protein
MLRVELRVAGQLDPRWAEWLAGLTITHSGDTETSLAGSVKDQAELYGLIAKLRDIGMKLISVQSAAADGKGEPTRKP